MRLKVYIWTNARRMCTWDIIDFFPTKHALRKKGKHFKCEADHQKKPVLCTGADILDMVKDLQVIFGKGPGG
jgi:hypothetical protein